MSEARVITMDEALANTDAKLAASEARAAQAWRIAMALARKDCIVSYGRQDGRDCEPRYWSVKIKGRFDEYTTLQAALIAWDDQQQKAKD